MNNKYNEIDFMAKNFIKNTEDFNLINKYPYKIYENKSENNLLLMSYEDLKEPTFENEYKWYYYNDDNETTFNNQVMGHFEPVDIKLYKNEKTFTLDTLSFTIDENKNLEKNTDMIERFDKQMSEYINDVFFKTDDSLRYCHNYDTDTKNIFKQNERHNCDKNVIGKTKTFIESKIINNDCIEISMTYGDKVDFDVVNGNLIFSWCGEKYTENILDSKEYIFKFYQLEILEKDTNCLAVKTLKIKIPIEKRSKKLDKVIGHNVINII